MTAQHVQHVTVRDIADFDGPPLQLIVQHACRKEPAQHLYNYLSVSRMMRAAILEHSAGTAEATYKSAQSLEEVDEFAAWLASHGHLLGSLNFSMYSMKYMIRFEETRDAAEKALASAVARSPCRGLHLQTCRLAYVGVGIADFLMELPGHSLADLTLIILQPESSTVEPATYLEGLSNSLQHLTTLQKLSLKFSTEKWRNNTVLDPMLQQLSALTNMTSLMLSDVLLTQPLRHLPASLQFLRLNIDVEASNNLDLSQLNALTRLETNEYTGMAGDYMLPPNLHELSVGDIYDVACVLPLTRLENLCLRYCDAMHPVSENLRLLSRLTSLKLIELDYGCDETSVLNNAADAWKLLPIEQISLSPLAGNISHNTIAQLGTLTQLTRLTLRLYDKCKFECTPTDFASALCKLTNLEQLQLRCCVHWEAVEKASASQLDPISLAISHLKWLKDLTIEKVPISHRAAKHLAESVTCQLVALTLWDNGVEDCDVITMLLASPRLEQLNLADNPLTDAILPVIAASCSGLISLYCSSGTEITNEGRELYVPHL